MRQPLRTHGYRAAAAAALACVLTATTQQAAQADPPTLTEVRARLQSLYHDAEVATDQYNAADEKVTAQQKRVGTLNGRVHTTEAELARLNSLAGATARAQYRSGGVPAEVQFALATDPGRALDNAGLALQAQQSTQNLLTDLTTTREDLRTRTDAAAAELKRLRASRRAMDTGRKKIEQHIAAARKLESQLAAKERRRLAALDKKAADDAQATWESTGILEKIGTDGTAAGKQAIAYATRQLGKPYVWGAEGPDSFDCSGLTSQAWLAAGHTIPRTSEEQWRRLKRIPVEDMRPGDLIIYFSDASHVALYMGDGKIVSAPRPGRDIYVSPAASMPILGVVRPDA
ncbi:C40 family peptidase [Streptomyces sp. NBC_00878]|uniref:C40 family peptidase n=1 Tax=Streptomyces sp. NBC_00878 TaxID=2975854 RepID=UPI00225A1F6C|nr:C40 family peptidase [Streptomyces sp. NBC_00878]MCX4904444.1 NlpC/P60 family protein [Streptomyces sp. NBC_00878]